jgi:aspartyl/asparaginyl-tRNA synthetase
MRSSGKVAFIELRDGTGYIQCVIELAKEGKE